MYSSPRQNQRLRRRNPAANWPPTAPPARISGSAVARTHYRLCVDFVSLQPLTRTHFSHVPDTFTTQLARGTSKGRYAFVSLGCPKNLVDSERMLGLLQLDGYELVNDPRGADFAVVNTCGFIEAARQESFAAIDEMLELKRRGELRGVIVSGCLAERQTRIAARSRGPGSTTSSACSAARKSRRWPTDCWAGSTEQRTVFHPAPTHPLPDTARHADHAAALRVSENLRRLRPAVHVLRDPEDARQALHEADGRSHRRGPRAGRRRRARAGDRRPGHDLLRHGPVRPSRGWPSCFASWNKSKASIGFA